MYFERFAFNANGSQCLDSFCFIYFIAAVSGCIVNTCGWVTGGGFKALLHIVQAFHSKYHEHLIF